MLTALLTCVILTGTVDRIEGDYAVVVFGDGQTLDIEAATFPTSPTEGQQVEVTVCPVAPVETP